MEHLNIFDVAKAAEGELKILKCGLPAGFSVEKSERLNLKLAGVAVLINEAIQALNLIQQELSQPEGLIRSRGLLPDKKVIDLVCLDYGVPRDSATSPRRTKDCVEARDKIVRILAEKYDWYPSRIARAFRKTHGAILESLKRTSKVSLNKH